MKFSLKFSISAFLIIMHCSTNAANVSVQGVPDTWRLQNYIPDGVSAFFTGSTCASGRLTMGANATSSDKSRFWSTIMAAKVSGKSVIVYYDDATTSCNITSFILQEE